MEIILRQARLSDGAIVDIGIDQGNIAAIDPTLTIDADVELQANGNLTLPAFVNGQLHACKSFWRRPLSRLSPEQAQLPRFEAASLVKQQYTAEDVIARVDETMRLAIRHGTCAIRLFADVDEDSGLAAIEGLLEIRRRYAHLMTVQVVAFPQDGLGSDEGLSLMRSAMALGADVVGGIPWIEQGTEAQQRHVERCFDIAQEHDCDLHFVCDDVADPTVRSLEMVARETIRRRWVGRVSATQCAALAFYPDEYAERVISLVAEAGIAIFSNSHVSLIATEFAPSQPWPRAITRVRELIDAGVPVACAQDDIDNWFYPFGRNDLLEVAQFMAHNGQFAWDGEVDRVLPMVTEIPASVLGLENYGLSVGNPADLVVLEANSWHDAIQYQAEKKFVLLRGKLVAESSRRTRFHLGLFG